MTLRTDLTGTFRIFSVDGSLQFFKCFMFSEESLIQKVNDELQRLIYFY